MLLKPRVQYHSREVGDCQAGGGATEEMQHLQEMPPEAEQVGKRYPDLPQGAPPPLAEPSQKSSAESLGKGSLQGFSLLHLTPQQ